MNGIISLCHFCEVHGPSILFCTQAFHANVPKPVLEAANSSLASSLCDGRKAVSAPVTPMAQNLPSPAQPTQPALKSTDLCEACRSLPAGQPGFISHDVDADVSYVSSQHPHRPQLFTMVRQACVRSLSCEVSPGREGPIFFGDDSQGYVLSYTFFVRDAAARGLQRWYSIIFVMMDKIYLLNSWPFLVGRMKTIIERIQAQAAAVYSAEEARCPPRAHRLMMGSTPSNYLLQRGGSKSARSLIELTNDKSVFVKLHRSFLRILKLGGSRLTERLLEGPPTEDSIIDLEKQEETEEGFIKLFSRKLSIDNDDDGELHCGEGVVNTPAEERDHTSPTFTHLRHVMQVLDQEKFHEVAYHAVIGNQVVVRGHSKRLVASMLDCLRVLVPRGCCRIIHYSNTYEDSWRCNFLGMPPNTPLPAHASLYIIIDIEEPPDKAGTCTGFNAACEPAADSLHLEHFTFTVSTPVVMPEKVPTVLTQMEESLLNDKLADSTVDLCLTCLKEEWMNKVKVVFKFTKAGGSRSDEDTTKLMAVVSAQEVDRSVLKFWMTGLSVQYRNHMLSSAIHKT